MESDPILQEIHAMKKQLAADSSYDLHTLCENLRKSESAQAGRLAEIPSFEPEKTALPASKRW